MSDAAGAPGRLQDKVAIVTGAGGVGGIGGAISLRFAKEGARVAVLDVNIKGAGQVADAIKAAGGTAIAVQCDVSELAQCQAAVREAADTFGGRVDILVNNAAYFGTIGSWRPFDEWTLEEWDRMQAVNVRGTWFCIQAVFPYMKAQKYGKIINVASSTFFKGVGPAHYTTSKAGVIGLTRVLGTELGPHGIRVNAIAPGFTLSEAGLKLTEDNKRWREINLDKQALKERNEVPEDLAGPALFLASPDSDFMTCDTLLVDGGCNPH